MSSDLECVDAVLDQLIRMFAAHEKQTKMFKNELITLRQQTRRRLKESLKESPITAI